MLLDIEPQSKMTKEQIKLAKRIYAENCAKCHGNKAKGNAFTPGFTSTQLDNYYATRVIVGGKNKMPSFGSVLNNSEIALVVNYLKTFYSNKYDSNYIKKAIAGTYELRSGIDSLHKSAVLHFAKKNTFTHKAIKTQSQVKGHYIIANNQNIILMDEKNYPFMMLSLQNIKNIKNELHIVNILSQNFDEQSRYVRIK